MSESPASRIAMVEQRKSLPQAVPSSTVVGNWSAYSVPSKALHGDFFAGKTLSGESQMTKKPRKLDLLLLPLKWWTLVLASMATYSSSDLRRGGVLPAMITSLAFERVRNGHAR